MLTIFVGAVILLAIVLAARENRTMNTNVQAAVDKLATELTETREGVESIVVLARGFPQAIKDAVAAALAEADADAETVAARINELADGFSAETDKLVAAVQNPGENPAPEPEPAPDTQEGGEQ